MPPKKPTGLGSRAAAVWRDITRTYTLRVDEQLVLEAACRTIDLIEAAEAQIDLANLRSTGSMGQDVSDPLMTEVRQQRALLARLFSQLALPDEDGAEDNKSDRSAAGRSLANSRWSGSGA